MLVGHLEKLADLLVVAIWDVLDSFLCAREVCIGSDWLLKGEPVSFHFNYYFQ